MKVKTMTETHGMKEGIDKYPNFSVRGSVKGMKERYYGKDALLVRCGGYIYDVTSAPRIYRMAH